MKETKLKLHPCYCGGEMEIKKVTQNGGMDGTYWDWKLTCNKCGLTKTYAADGFYGREYKTFEEVVDDWNKNIDVKVVVEDAYNKGLNDAWECVRKITKDKSMAEWVILSSFFGVGRYDFFKIFKKYSASEAIEILEKYEAKNGS